jgi:hypothetical protein
VLKERDVLDALPSQGFLREYVHFAMSCTDAHAAYHLACGLIGLSQAVPPSYLIPFASPIYSNMFTMVVGDSSRSRKTTAINIIQNMLREAIPGSVGETPGSTEGVSESLRANPRQVIIYGEFGEFLAKAENGYLMPLKTAYTSAWDCSPMGRATANSRRGMVTDPRLSLLCGVATDLLERHTEQADWTGGFLARFLTFHAEPERVLASMPIPNRQQKDQLTNWLRQLADPMLIPGQCNWLDAPEKLVWDQWWASMKPMRDSANRRAQAACARAGALAQKVALLLAWDLGEGRTGHDFHVGREAVESAIKITNLHIQSVLELGERVTGNKDMRDRAMVLRAIGDKLVPLGVIIKNTDMLKKRIKDVVESLLEERSIEAVASGNLVFYRQTPESHQRLVQIADQVTQASNAGELDGLGMDGNQQVAKVLPLLPRPVQDPALGGDATQPNISDEEDDDLSYYDSLPM